MKSAIVFLTFWTLCFIVVVVGVSPLSAQQPAGQPADQARTIEGEIAGVKVFELAVLDMPHLFARIQSDQREKPFRVDLGPRRQLESLNIKKGDRITVGARKGTVNEKPMWMATWVDTGEVKQAIRRRTDRNLKSMKVRVLRTREVSYEQADIPDQLFARVGMGQGEVTTIINLGPVDNIPEDLKLEGREIFILVRPAKIGGRMALVAEAFMAEDGEMIEVDRNLSGTGVPGINN